MRVNEDEGKMCKLEDIGGRLTRRVNDPSRGAEASKGGTFSRRSIRQQEREGRVC